jgi:hypothetical protein
MENNDFSIKDLKKLIGKFDLEENEKKWIVKKNLGPLWSEYKINIIINKNWFENKLDELKEFRFSNFSLYNCKGSKESNYFEHPIRILNESHYLKLYDAFQLNNLNFEITSPSEIYYLFLYLSKGLGLGWFRDSARYLIMNLCKENLDNIQFQDFIKRLNKILKFKTLTIKSNLPLNYKEFQKLADSYLFYCAYNGDVSILQVNPLEFGDKIIFLDRYYTLSEIIGQNLDEELIAYYKTAVSSNDPFIEFISFYHILEYFFRKVHGEKRELKSVLRKFISLDKFKEELKFYDEYSYFINNGVKFANAKPIGNDFYETLAERIYAVRNALVHRKEEYDYKYLPFKWDHRKELQIETILMRIIATQIILNSSKNNVKYKKSSSGRILERGNW